MPAERITSNSPWHVVFVIDDSEPMGASGAAKSLTEALDLLIAEMKLVSQGTKPYFKLSIIAMGQTAHVVVEAESEQTLDFTKITAFSGNSGTADMAAALNEAAKLLQRNPGRPTDFTPHVILVTMTEPANDVAVIDAARAIHDMEIAAGKPQLVALGLGNEVKMEFLQQIASSRELAKRLERPLDFFARWLPPVGTIVSGAAADPAPARDPRLEYIRDLYRDLTALGEEAGKRAASFLTMSKEAVRTAGLQAVQVGLSSPAGYVPGLVPPAGATHRAKGRPAPDAGMSAAAPTVRADPTLRLRPVPATDAPPIANPVRVCVAAIRVVVTNRGMLFSFGLLFAAILGMSSGILTDLNIKSGHINVDRPLGQLLFLAIVAYALGTWIRCARWPGASPGGFNVAAGDLLTAVAIALTVHFVGNPMIRGEHVLIEFRSAALFAKIWPLHGPYASMATGLRGLPLYDLPAAAAFLEPFAYTTALLPAMLLTPFIVREYRNALLNWLLFILCSPFVAMAVCLGTLPIALLNISLAGWARAAVVAGDRLPVMFALSFVLYVQIAIVGSAIGICHRRLFARS